MKYEKPAVTILFAAAEDIVTASDAYEPSKDYNVGEGWF